LDPSLQNSLSNLRLILAAAAVLHVGVTLSVFCIGQLEIFPHHFNLAGIGNFAPDSHYFQAHTNSLADTLRNEGVVSWFKQSPQLHEKLYSLSLVVLRPLFGPNILAVEPVNLFCYLAIVFLTFSLAKEVIGQRAALVSVVIVALWPSLLLHTTQFLKDPLLIASMLAVILVLSNLLMKTYKLAKGLAMGLAGSAAAAGILMTRSEVWTVVRVTALAALALYFIRTLRERKLLTGNLAGLVLLVAMTTFALPIQSIIQREFSVSLGSPARDPELALWARIALRRQGFILSSYGQFGSTIDSEVTFESQSDVIRYIPRAFQIGFFAPFPKMWFSSGYHVGLIGRLVSGFETLLTYAIELMACVFVWRNRRLLPVWLLVIAATLGILALGLVVVNVGTLYRMRYSSWVLLVILGSGGLVQILSGRLRSSKVVDLHSDQS
jgi:4-amino-4-deoxy-L-arabinose transferase-like glycosyltransferase